MKCPKCGKETEAKFCPECGTQIEESTATRSTQPQKDKPKRPIYKKWWFWVLIALAVIIIIGSTSGNNKKDNNSSNNSSSSTVSSNTQSTSSNSQNTPADSGTLGKYEVAIKDASLAKDYEGNPAMIVTFSFKNNSDKAQSFTTSIHDIAYQDGVQLSTGVVVQDNSPYEDSIKNVQPGTTLEVKQVYKLSNTSSPVQVEASEIISFSNEKVAKTFDLASLPNNN